MDNIKVSVIMPVYNAAAFLEKNLLILSRQKLKEIEFICVNDKSTDNTLDILLAFKQVFSDKFVIINSEKNRGPGGARNIALKYARGEYIGFVDADDNVNDNMFSDMYNEAKKGDYDIVSCGYYNEGEGKDIAPLVIKGELDDRSRYAFIMTGSLYTVNKIYKSELIKSMSMHFRERMQFEDMDFVLEAVFRAKTVSVVEKIYYYYRYNEDSLTKKAKFSFNMTINSLDELMLSVSERCNSLVREDMLEHFKWLLFELNIKNLFFTCFVDPNMNYETYKRIHELSRKWFPDFCSIKEKSKKESDILEEAVWNEICEDPTESFEKLVKFKKLITDAR